LLKAGLVTSCAFPARILTCMAAMGETAASEIVEAQNLELEARLLKLIRRNAEKREDRRTGTPSSTDSGGEDSCSCLDDFAADLVLEEENGFELWLGSMDDALCLRSLQARGFGAVLNCAVEECERECAAHRGAGRGRRRAHARGASAFGMGGDDDGPPLDRDKVRAVALFDGEWYSGMLGRDTAFLGIAADDVEGYGMERHFGEIGEFLQRCRAEGRKVLAHCIMGVNRSSVAIAAFLCGQMGMPLEDAVDLISQGRGSVLSNSSFLRQLISAYGPESERMARHEDQVGGEVN